MNLVLIGLRGTGKSTVGRLLAERLQRPFFDTDTLVQQRAGKTIREIFEQDGEAAFRALESAVVRECAQQRNAVLATGGGAVLDPQNTAALRAGRFRRASDGQSQRAVAAHQPGCGLAHHAPGAAGERRIRPGRIAPTDAVAIRCVRCRPRTSKWTSKAACRTLWRTACCCCCAPTAHTRVHNALTETGLLTHPFTGSGNTGPGNTGPGNTGPGNALGNQRGTSVKT